MTGPREPLTSASHPVRTQRRRNRLTAWLLVVVALLITLPILYLRTR